VKLISWNVNGFRAAVRKGFYDFLEKEKPDILALQEIKSDEVPHFPIGFSYKVFWNPAKKKGYSGTAIFTKEKPRSYLHGLGEDKFDNEGRVTTLEFEAFYLINAYFPNSQRDLARLSFKLEFNQLMKKHLDKLKKKKPVVLCGDLNVAHEPIDIARPKANEGKSGYTKEERNWITGFLKSGYLDTYRALHPKKEEYSWWTYRFGAREKNIGWRIDYFVVNSEYMESVKKAEILTSVMGSDHAPIFLETE